MISEKSSGVSGSTVREINGTLRGCWYFLLQAANLLRHEYTPRNRPGRSLYAQSYCNRPTYYISGSYRGLWDQGSKGCDQGSRRWDLGSQSRDQGQDHKPYHVIEISSFLRDQGLGCIISAGSGTKNSPCFWNQGSAIWAQKWDQ